MKKQETIKRYFVFFIGLLCNAFGVAFATRSALGSSPLAAIPYSLSLVIPSITMGNWVIIFNLLLVALQWIMLKKEANKPVLFLQAVMTFCFGYFTDFSLWVLKDLNPTSYVEKVITLAVGCLVLGLAIFFELAGNVVMLPGSAFSKVVAEKLHKQYGTIRVASDVTMTVISGAISLIFLKKLVSVREGTIIAAFLVGNLFTMWKKILSKFEVKLNNWITK